MNDIAEFIDTVATGDEQVIAKHIHAHTLPSGHVPMLSRPKEVATAERRLIQRYRSIPSCN